MKKLIGILYSTPMVLALLAELKTQTRRITGKLKLINENLSYDWKLTTERVVVRDAKTKQDRQRTAFNFNATGINTVTMFSPYGEPGDVLWVRETFRKHYPTDGNGNIDWSNPVIDYAADNPEPILLSDGDGFNTQDKKGNDRYVPYKPSLHMPYAACRIWLEVVSIRIERLQDINEADALAEGIARTLVTTTDGVDGVRYQNYSQRHDINHPLHRWTQSAIHSYKTLWKKINGPESWESNPYVWVVEFKRTDKPADL